MRREYHVVYPIVKQLKNWGFVLNFVPVSYCQAVENPYSEVWLTMSDYDPLHSDRIVTRGVGVSIKLTPDEIEALDRVSMMLQMNASQWVTKLVKGALKSYM